MLYDVSIVTLISMLQQHWHCRALGRVNILYKKQYILKYRLAEMSKIMSFGVGNQTYQVIKVDDQSLSIFKWKSLEQILLVFCLTVTGLICISGQSMIIHYIHKYSKKERPYNKLILIDQVSPKVLHKT